MSNRQSPADDDTYDSSQERDSVKDAVKVIKAHLVSIKLKDLYDVQEKKNKKKSERKEAKAMKSEKTNEDDENNEGL